MSRGRVEVSVLDDGLTAAVATRPGDRMDRESLLAILADHGVVFGVDEAAVGLLAGRLANPRYEARQTIVARGIAAVDGLNGRFEATFEVGLAPGRLRKDGSIDYHDRDLLKPVDAGARLGVVHPPTPGEPGRRVDGRPLPPVAGRPLRLTVGRGVRAAEGGALVAARAGVIAYVPGVSLAVEDRYEHAGNVDLESGNVKMDGALVVRGDVEPRLSARASGDLEILGLIDGGSAEAGGSLRVKGGIHGGPDALVSAQGDIIAHHTGAANVQCGGTLHVAEAVNSRLIAANVEITRCVRGGHAQAEDRIVVGEAGTPGGVATYLVAGEPLDVERGGARSQTPASTSRRRPELGSSLPRGKGEHASTASNASSQRAAGRKNDLIRRRADLRAHAHVDVLGVAHPGVVVLIGEAKYVVDEPTRHVRFSVDPETGRVRCEKLPH